MKEEKEMSFSEVLEKIFGQESPPVSLLYKLSDLIDENLNAFMNQWQAAADDRREVVARHLADIMEESFVVDFTAVFVLCLRDSLASIRIAALDGLWDSGNVMLLPQILILLQDDENDGVRKAAAKALTHFVMMAEWEEIPALVVEPVVTALLAVYDDEETAVIIKCAALEALGASSHPRIPNLISTAYESDAAELQQSSLFAMGNSADSRWIPTLLDEMESPYVDMRAEAARAAGAIGSSDAVSELANLTVDSDLDVQLAAVAALGQIGGDHARQILDQIQHDPELEALHELAEESLEESVIMGEALDLLDFGDFDEYENGA